MPTIARQQFWNGLTVDQDHRNETAQKVFDDLTENPNKLYSTILCGDMLVIGQRRGQTIIISNTHVLQRTDYNPDGTHVYPERNATR